MPTVIKETLLPLISCARSFGNPAVIDQSRWLCRRLNACILPVKILDSHRPSGSLYDVPKKHRTLLIATLVTVLSAVTFLMLQATPREPVYEGKTLSVWLHQSTGLSGPLYDKAGEAIRHIGPNGIPFLLKMLTARKSVLVTKILATGPTKIFARLHLPGLMEYESRIDQRRGLAVLGFAQLGELARPGVPALTDLVTDADPIVRNASILALGSIGSSAGAAVPSLLRSLDDVDFTVRYGAVRSLGYIHQRSEDVVPKLMDRLQKWQTPPILRVAVIDSLSWFGPQAKSAVPRLVELLNDNETSVRYAASKALRNIDFEAAVKTGVR